MKKVILMLFVSMLSVSMSSLGQNNFGVSATQAGSSNGSANNVSNDLFTGTANISIPLVVKNVEGIDLGISISYNTKGIKLDDVSSVVGLGWNLSYGGTITRVVRGLPDEFLYQNANGAKFNYGYWHRNNSDIPYTPNPNYIPKHIGETEAKTNIAVEAADGQMDIFSLYLNGMKLDFMINANNEVQTIPNNSRIKIQRTVNGNIVNTFVKGTVIAEFGFMITDENGNKFYFTGGEKVRANLLYPCPTDLINVSEFYAISWNLDRIETYNGKRIQYDYKDDIPYLVSMQKEMLRDAAKSVRSMKTLGNYFGIAGLLLTGGDIIFGNGPTSSNNLDLAVGMASFEFPVLGLVYFPSNEIIKAQSGKDIATHLDQSWSYYQWMWWLYQNQK